MGLNILKYLSNLKKQDESEVITNKQKFDSVMRVANEIAKDRPRDLYKLIKILGKKIQYDYFADFIQHTGVCLLYTSPSPRDRQKSRMPSSA